MLVLLMTYPDSKSETLAARCYARDVELVTRQVAGETILVPVRGRVGDLEAIFTLNEVGTLVWGLLDGETPVERMVAAVCEEYEVSDEQAEADVLMEGRIGETIHFYYLDTEPYMKVIFESGTGHAVDLKPARVYPPS